MASSVEKIASQAQLLIDKEATNDPFLKKTLLTVRQFLEDEMVICYGGTAINNLLPKEDQFYNPERDIPDYDFFSAKPQFHAAKLADKLKKIGIKSVDVSPGVHLGTFKVFADFIGVADISFLPKPIFKKVWKDSTVREKIHYVSPNFLRMLAYLELSRPRGFVERWNKVYQRISLLNKHYPIECPKKDHTISEEHLDPEIRKKIEKFMIEHKIVLLGFNASNIQSGFKEDWKLPIDCLVTPETREKISDEFSEIFKPEKKIMLTDYPAYGELFPAHTDITEGSQKLLVRIFETNACHSYVEQADGLHVASISTLLQFFIGVLYADHHFSDNFSQERFLCSAEHLLKIKSKKSLTPITCLGKQETMVDMKRHKADLLQKLSQDKNSPAYLEYFFRYSPTSMTETKRKETWRNLKKLV